MCGQLLDDPNGALSSLVDGTGAASAAHLRQQAYLSVGRDPLGAARDVPKRVPERDRAMIESMIHSSSDDSS